MKKKITKKQTKAEKTAKKRLSPIEELQQRNMRLTQEFDRLSTRVAAQGDLLFRIHQTLQTEMMMPYEVVVPMPVEVPGSPVSPRTPKGAQPMRLFSSQPTMLSPKKSQSEVQPQQKLAPKIDPAQTPPPAEVASGTKLPEPKVGAPKFIGSLSRDMKGYVVKLMSQGTLLGYLAHDATWTFDPEKIGRFDSKDAINELLSKAKMQEGAKPKIEEQRHW